MIDLIWEPKEPGKNVDFGGEDVLEVYPGDWSLAPQVECKLQSR